MVFSINNCQNNQDLFAKRLAECEKKGHVKESYGAGLGTMLVSLTCIPMLVAMVALPIIPLVRSYLFGSHKFQKELTKDNEGYFVDKKMGKSEAFNYPEYMYAEKKYTVKDLKLLKAESQRIEDEKTLEKCDQTFTNFLFCLIPLIGFFMMTERKIDHKKIVLLNMQKESIEKHIAPLENLESERLKKENSEKAQALLAEDLAKVRSLQAR